MSVKFTINGPAFDRELKSSVAKLNNKSVIEKSLKLSNGELLIKKIEKDKKCGN